MTGAAEQIEAELGGVDTAGAGKSIGQNVSRCVGRPLAATQRLGCRTLGRRYQALVVHSRGTLQLRLVGGLSPRLTPRRDRFWP